MKIVWIGNKDQMNELLAQGLDERAELTELKDPAFPGSIEGIDACIDLLFDDTGIRIKKLQQLQAPVTIIHSVITPLNELTSGFIRINGWNTFLKRPAVEAACKDDRLKEKAEKVFSFLNKKVDWVPDIAGFITPRVVASIINEAFFALEEQVSTKEEIDTAMKLGTNYPFGPFEWSEKIGLRNIVNLLSHLSKEQKRYEPSALLIKEASR
ncbi:MAG: 3-hydroxyacyl-CoA dehydrogenase family protein [Bacteroidota bacterium]|nr:3-hydroxyacyl-CoA dehydrogenase family protein [Bacteroidota bacterium]